MRINNQSYFSKCDDTLLTRLVRRIAIAMLLLPSLFLSGVTEAGLTADKSFGNNGRIVLDTFHDYEAFSSLTLDAQNRVVVAGNITVGGESDVLVKRFTAAGELDTDFATDGIRLLNTTEDLESLTQLAIDINGRIIAAGKSGDAIRIIALDSKGNLDNQFGNSGIATLTLPVGLVSEVRSMTVDFGGKITVAATWTLVLDGEVTNTILVSRFNRDGTQDTAFGALGSVSLTAPAANAGAMVQHGNGSYTIAGFLGNKLHLFRLNADSSIMSSFGNEGVAVANIPTDSIVSDIVFNPTLDAYLVSFSNANHLLRITAEGEVDFTYSAKPVADNNIIDVTVRLIMPNGAFEFFVAGTCGVAGETNSYVAHMSFAEESPDDYTCLSYSEDGDANSDSYVQAAKRLNSENLYIAGYYWNSLNNDFALMKITSVETASSGDSDSDTTNDDNDTNATGNTRTKAAPAGSGGGGSFDLLFLMILGIAACSVTAKTASQGDVLPTSTKPSTNRSVDSAGPGEYVSFTTNSLNEFRIFTATLKFATQFDNQHVDAPIVWVPMTPRGEIKQTVSTQYSTFVLDKNLEQAIFARCEGDVSIIPVAQGHGLGIQNKGAELEAFCSGAFISDSFGTDQRTNARQQLAVMKRFGHVIVSAQFQSQHFIHGVTFTSQKDDGQISEIAPHLLDQAKPILFREPDVKQHQVGDGRGKLPRHSTPVFCDIDDIAFQFQEGTNGFTDELIVIDKQDSGVAFFSSIHVLPQTHASTRLSGNQRDAATDVSEIVASQGPEKITNLQKKRKARWWRRALKAVQPFAFVRSRQERCHATERSPAIHAWYRTNSVLNARNAVVHVARLHALVSANFERTKI